VNPELLCSSPVSVMSPPSPDGFRQATSDATGPRASRSRRGRRRRRHYSRKTGHGPDPLLNRGSRGSRAQEVGIRAPTSGARRSCTPAAAARTSGEQSSTAPLPPPPRAASPAPSPSAHPQPPVERKERRRGENG